MQHRSLLVILAVTLSLVVVVVVGLVLLYPRGDKEAAAAGEQSSATQAQSFDPIEYLRDTGLDKDSLLAPQPVDEVASDELVIVYGDRQSPATSSTATSPDNRAEEGEGATIGQEDSSSTAIDRVASRTEPALARGDDAVDQKIVRVRRSGDRSAGTDMATAPAHSTSDDNSISNERAAFSAAASKPTPQSATPPSRNRNLNRWIQLFSSTNLDRVVQARAMLTEYQISGLIVTETIAGDSYYRLRVGPFASRAEADKFLHWLNRVPAFADGYITISS